MGYFGDFFLAGSLSSDLAFAVDAVRGMEFATVAYLCIRAVVPNPVIMFLLTDGWFHYWCNYFLHDGSIIHLVRAVQFGSIWTNLDQFGPIWTSVIWTNLDPLGLSHLDQFGPIGTQSFGPI